MRVKESTDTGLLTERQWAKQGFLRNPDAVGVTLWTNRHCQHTALYLTEKEVHKAAPDELAAYWLPERQKRAKRRRELAAEKAAQAERERLAMESLIDRLHDRISRLEEIAKSLFRQIPVDAPISAEEIVMDIETTGLECGYDEILQISILSGAGETLYHSYIRPIHAEDWQEAERINHITPDMVADAPCIYEEMPKITMNTSTMTATAAPILEVRDLCKTYIVNKRQNNVLRNVSFRIDAGEMVAVMAPSGSGKSTLLYTVSGMDRMTAGDVTFCGRDMSKLRDHELAKMRLDDMGFIFQQMYMMKNLSILDNIILPSVKSDKIRESRKDTVARARDLMRGLGISEIADNDINEVSGGQLQRACICRSMMNRPQMIFADEPTGALNRTSSEEVMAELEKLNADGTTVMLVTHDAKVAAKCTRVLFIVDGNIKGEYNIDKKLSVRDRERALNNWLMEMGW